MGRKTCPDLSESTLRKYGCSGSAAVQASCGWSGGFLSMYWKA